MSTKTIAVDTQIHQRLASVKRESESFSKVIGRLLDESESAKSAADVLASLPGLKPLNEAECETMEKVVRENRRETWPAHDLS